MTSYETRAENLMQRVSEGLLDVLDNSLCGDDAVYVSMLIDELSALAAEIRVSAVADFLES